ncbi:MAG: methionine adenosyltransferase [Sphaerochaetaceae bacterium]|nr:methionine adenosyltransferase [Sphaerochaetaceae bacterium]
MKKHLFTSESVSEGHPDKVCDQISDAILDACLDVDKNSRVACETFATTDFVLVGGEITTTASFDTEKIVREVVRSIGYDDPSLGFSADSLQVKQLLHTQSPDIALGVDEKTSFSGSQGAGDQGLMFGYACDETPELMPAPVMYSHMLLKRAAHLRKVEGIQWMRPDSKAQVTLQYENDRPVAIDTVVLSHQHSSKISNEDLKKFIKKEIIEYVLKDTGLLSDATVYHINPTGRFVDGGPAADTGLTGRKIIVDTYGGMARHGGGAFSGKDPSKVDRSACYMARFVAKNLVAWGLCKRVEIQLSYAIGVADPVSISVDTFNTGLIPDSEIEKIIYKEFDFSPKGIIGHLDLRRPIYRDNMNYGHFGKDGVPWETILPKPRTL